MRLHETFLLLFSAVSFGSAFLCVSYCWWFVFIFLLPIFYLAQQQALSFWAGFQWGIVFFTLHCYGILMVLWEKAEGQWRLAAGVFLILYCALHSGLWFYGAHQISKRTSKTISCFGVWVILTWAYFWWITHGVFWIFGQWFGYSFSSPLLPLAQHPFLLAIIPYAGELMLLFILILFQALIVGLCLNLSWVGGLWPACLLPFLFGFYFFPVDTSPHWLEHLCYVSPPLYTQTSYQEQGEAINMQILLALQKKPNAKIVVMPESTCLFSLNTHQEVAEIWAHNALENNIDLLIGASRADQQMVYNSIFLLSSSRITKTYDKITCVPFSEFTPFPWNKFNYFKELFLKDKKDFSQKGNSCAIFEIAPKVTLIPQICSDLFLGQGPAPDFHPSSPILFIVNDAWFSQGYYRNLMFLFTVLKAVSLQRDIIYVGHTYGAWVSKQTGRVVYL